MRIFDTNVQKLKYDVLREVARHAYADLALLSSSGDFNFLLLVAYPIESKKHLKVTSKNSIFEFFG